MLRLHKSVTAEAGELLEVQEQTQRFDADTANSCSSASGKTVAQCTEDTDISLTVVKWSKHYQSSDSHGGQEAPVAATADVSVISIHSDHTGSETQCAFYCPVVFVNF